MLEFKNVNKVFQTSKSSYYNALININFKVFDGDIFGIIGLSGAGKSTILRLIAGLEFTTSGEILINNTNFALLSKKQRREYYKNVGVVFQGYHLLYQKNIYDNISLPMKLFKYPEKEIEKKTRELINLVGLSDKTQMYPSMLSGGQKQRVAIARALALNPKILLLDEITSALDPKTTIEILNLLKEIHEKDNITIIMITHEIAVASFLTNKLAVLNYGEITEIGNTSDIINNPKAQITKMLLGRKDI